MKNTFFKSVFITNLLVLSSICIICLNSNAQEVNDQENLDSLIIKARAILFSSPDKAFDMSVKAIDLSKKQNNYLMLANSYRLQGSYFTDIKGDFESAKKVYVLADSIYRSNHGPEFREGVGAIYHCYGTIDQRQGNYYNAIQNYSKALNILDSLGNKSILPKTLNNISILYVFFKDYIKAEDYARECLKICIENNDVYLISVVSVGLADALISQGKYDDVPNLLTKAREIAKSRNDLYILELSYLNFGNYYYLYKKDFKKAISEYSQALKYAEALGSEWEKIRVKTNLSEIYFLDNQIANAQKAAEQVIEPAKIMQAIDIQQRALEILSKVEASKKNYSKAYDYLNLSFKLKDTVFNENNQRHINYLESLYQTEKKEKEIVVLQSQQKESDLLLKRRNILIVTLAGFMLLILLVAFLTYVRIKDRQVIKDQQIKIQEQQIRKLEQEKQLIATQSLLEGETTERARLSKDLHDGLGGLLSVTKHKIATMKGSLTIPEDQVEPFNSALEMLDSSIKELRRVAHNLMPESLMRYGLNSAISDFCNSIDKAKYHFYGAEKRLDEKLEVAAFRIISELVNNALKHANASKINVQLVQEQDRISFTVYDDGCGFDPKAIDRTKSGGLNNIESRVISFNGRLDILSEPGKGTEISVEFKC